MNARSAWLALALLGAPAAVSANGRFAGAYQIVSMPGKPDTLTLRTTFGLLLSSDRGAHWDWVCEGAIGYGMDGAIEDPTIALTGGGAAIAGLQGGVSASLNGGCAWSFVLMGAPVIDVTVARSSPSTVVVITSAGMVTQLHRSTNDGASFAPYGAALDPSVFPITVDVAPSKASTIYVSARRGFGNASLFVSIDDAASWTERPIPVAMSEKDAYIAAVDPVNADRVYIRTLDAISGGGRLLVTGDAGKTWTTRFTGKGVLTGFALSNDGSKVWIGGDDDGLHLADTTSFAFAQISMIRPKCLGAFGSRLYACVNDGDFLDVSEDDGKTFVPLLPYCGLRGPVTCAPDSSASVCAADWPGLMMGLGGPCLPDAGDASADDSGDRPDAGDGGLAPAPRSGCGCGQGEPTGTAALGLVWALAILWRHGFRKREGAKVLGADRSWRARRQSESHRYRPGL